MLNEHTIVGPENAITPGQQQTVTEFIETLDDLKVAIDQGVNLQNGINISRIDERGIVQGESLVCLPPPFSHRDVRAQEPA